MRPLSQLKAAAGANYDLGNIRSGATGTGSVSYKNKSKEFFTQKDKESEIKDVQYEKVRSARCALATLASDANTHTRMHEEDELICDLHWLEHR